jgi:hypothetical protein
MSENLSRNREIEEAIKKLRSILWGTDDENFGSSVYFIESVLRKLKEEKQ